MAKPSLYDKNTVIKFLTENETLNHSQAKKLLDDVGIHMSHITIAKIRRDNAIPYKKPESVMSVVSAWHKSGMTVTMAAIKKRWPDIKERYAKRLVYVYSPIKKKKKYAPKEVKVAEPLLTKIKVGAVTRYEFR